MYVGCVARFFSSLVCLLSVAGVVCACACALAPTCHVHFLLPFCSVDSNVIIQISRNLNTWTTVFNNDNTNTDGQGVGAQAPYSETAAGRLIQLATPTNATYVRSWCGGSSTNAFQHYIEIQVFDNKGVNVALNKPVVIYNGYATDGSLSTGFSGPVNCKALTIDLGSAATVSAALVLLGMNPTVFAMQRSLDRVHWTTIFDDDATNTTGRGIGTDPVYSESSTPHAFTLGATKLRYLRWTVASITSASWQELQVFEQSTISFSNATIASPLTWLNDLWSALSIHLSLCVKCVFMCACVQGRWQSARNGCELGLRLLLVHDRNARDHVSLSLFVILYSCAY